MPVIPALINATINNLRLACRHTTCVYINMYFIKWKYRGIMKESDYQKSGISALLIHIYLGYILSNFVLVVDDTSLY